MSSDQKRPEAYELLSAEELVARQGVRPIASVDELRTDLWSSDAELDEFIADLRRSRRSDRA